MGELQRYLIDHDWFSGVFYKPHDPCCYSCTTSAPASCAPCPDKTAPGVDDGAYQANIRCWQQKRRFGYEFMYPTSRYVVGLTNPTLCPDQSFGDMDCNCTYAKSIGTFCDPGSRAMPNPLYSTIVGTAKDGSQVPSATPNAIPRSDNSAEFIAGIVGVPWQDIGYMDANGNLVYIPVTDPAWAGAPTAGGLAPTAGAPNGIWANVYGDDNQHILPQDMHMIESIVPHVAGQNVDGITGSLNVIPDKAPWDGQTIPGPTAAANADPFNGHEWNTALEDLEYACIFHLPQPRQCPCASTSNDYAACKYQHPNDCCDLSFSVVGTGSRNVVEVVSGQTATSQASDCTTFCQNNQRGTADSQMQTAVLGSMNQSGLCDHAGQPACRSMCLCLLNQESGSASTNNNPGGATDLAVC